MLVEMAAHNEADVRPLQAGEQRGTRGRLNTGDVGDRIVRIVEEDRLVQEQHDAPAGGEFFVEPTVLLILA